MAPQTTMKSDKVTSWPPKPRQATQAENAAIRKKVQEVADRAREERIKGRPSAWIAPKK